MTTTFVKDTIDVKDYQRDWTKELARPDGPDTIATSTWIVQPGLTKNSDTHTATTATVWLSGGVLGTEYEVRNVITTAGGRTEVATWTIEMRQK